MATANGMDANILAQFVPQCLLVDQSSAHLHIATRIFWVSVAGFFAAQTTLISNIDVYWRGGWLLSLWSSTLALSMAGLVLAICLGAGGVFVVICSCKIMVWLGELSFRVYLWHFPVMQLLKALHPLLAFSACVSLLAIAITMPLTLGLAALSYYNLESPLMKARAANL